jgi:hypothetical protein
MTTAEAYLPADIAQIHVDESNRGFWEACNERVLTAQQCQACGHYQHPPRVGCAACQSADLAWAPLPGTGTIYTATVAHHGIGGLVDRVPFNIIVVELDVSATRLVSNLVDEPADGVPIGAGVAVVWEQATDDQIVPRFALADNGS